MTRVRAWRWHLNAEQKLLLVATVFPSVFFTFSGNILWTYQLPALAPFALLLATVAPSGLFAGGQRQLAVQRRLLMSAAVVPLVFVGATLYVQLNPADLKTEKSLVMRYQQLARPGEEMLTYVGNAPFSARFYANGKIRHLDLDEAKAMLAAGATQAAYLAVPNASLSDLLTVASFASDTLYQNKRYTLLKIQGPADSLAMREEAYAIDAGSKN